jgi:hypothetical protein
MTETTKLAGEATGVRLCQAGSKSERPCWRPATEVDLGDTEPTLCPEHMKVRRCGENLDARLHALEATRAFLKSEAVEHDPHSYLRELAIGWYDSVTEVAASAAHNACGRVPGRAGTGGRGTGERHHARVRGSPDRTLRCHKRRLRNPHRRARAFGDGAPRDNCDSEGCLQTGQ